MMEFGWMFLRMIAVLAAVCALAFVMLKWGLRRFVPFDTDQQGRLEVVERLAVGPKRTILTVRAGSQYLLVGSSEAGFELLGRLDADDWAQHQGESLQSGAGADELDGSNESKQRDGQVDASVAASIAAAVE